MRCPVCDYEDIPEGTATCPRCLSPLRAPRGDTRIDLDMDVGEIHSGGRATGVEISGPGDVYIDVDPRRIAQHRRNRKALLDIVWVSWIEGVLEKVESTHAEFTGGEALILLNRRSLPSAVALRSDADDEISYLAETAAEEESRKPIDLLFEDTSDSLLLLGEPGSGKTIALLQIARDQCRKAWRDDEHPVPVVLNLASWHPGFPDLASWVLDELSTSQYRVPQNVGRDWLEKNELTVLLDGLDEVPFDWRDDCAREINRFTAEHFAGIAVCSRLAEYEDIIRPNETGAEENHLQLRRATLLESLTDDQIDHYLEAAGSPLAEIRRAVARDSSVRELIRTPLMLGIISVTYKDVPLDQLPTEPSVSAEAWRSALFDAYISRMFAYKGSADKPYADSQTIAWLSWLAGQMTQHHQVTFLTEALQPSWLPEGRWRYTYMLASRMIVMLLGGTIGGFILGVANSITLGPFFIFLGLVQGLTGGVIAGLVSGLVDIFWIERRQDAQSMGNVSRLRQSVVKFALLALSVWATVIAGFFLLSLLLGGTALAPTMSLGQGVQVGLILGLCCGWIFAFGPSGVRQNWSNDIQSVERLSWSSNDALRSGIRGALIGAVVGVVATYVARFTPLTDPIVARFADSTLVLIVMTIISAVFLGIAGAVLGGVRGAVVDSRDLRPNQGFRMSMINAGVTAVVVGLLFGFLGAITGSLLGGTEVIATMALYGLFFGVVAAFWYGGLFAFQHATLRWLLARLGYTPRLGRLTPFLMYATRRLFLRRVGGGFIFAYRYLQAHFSAMDTGERTDDA